MTRDLDWREAELGSLKLLCARSDLTKQQKLVLLRAAWALLYAHYEGFTKTALTIYYDEARKKVKNCGSLPEWTRLFALQSMLKNLRKLPAKEFLSEIENFPGNHHATKPTFPEVETKSNLWHCTLDELLNYADLSMSYHHKYKHLINTLVSRRNKIAHGKIDIIKELDYYRTHETAIYDIMYELSYCIDNRLKQHPYV